MAKRFTDTEKWEKLWYRLLKPEIKCFWNYICDRCDLAGVWNVDFELARVYVGRGFREQDMREALKKQIVEFKPGKWWVIDFCDFQYGALQETQNFHKSIITTLKQHGLWDTYIQRKSLFSGAGQGQACPRSGALDKDKEKDKDIKEGGMGETSQAEEIYSHYAKTIKAGAREGAVKSITKLLKAGETRDKLLDRIDAYRATLDAQKRQDPEFWIQANNFFGRAARWKDFEPVKKIEYGPADPACTICRGDGSVYAPGSGKTSICVCRRSAGKL